jgi:catechol 2,3-dioxygenase-like lactoylglutathione lyase family enzyme
MPIAIVSIPVTDRDRARDFYIREMGFTLLRDEPMGPDMQWIQLQPADGGATIALVTWLEGLKPGGQQGLLLGVPDVDAAHARLTGYGVECTPIEEQPWGRFTMLKDPDGNGWIVTQLTDPDEVKSR